MKTRILNFFKWSETTKPTTHGKNAPLSESHKTTSHSEFLFKTMPSWWVVLFAYILAYVFCECTHRFFIWFPPYLLEIFKNLRGLPASWAELGLYWGERGLKTIAVVAAVYHNLWQLGTRYKLTPNNINLVNWFPLRKVTNVPYGSVRKVGFQQSLLGLACNYGHIEIDTGSPSGPLVLLNCPRPKKFIDLLQPKVESVVQPNLAHHRRTGDP